MMTPRDGGKKGGAVEVTDPGSGTENVVKDVMLNEKKENESERVEKDKEVGHKAGFKWGQIGC